MLDDRTQPWLETALHQIWTRYFPDVAPANIVQIAFCRPSRTRLGWIALSESGRYTHIGINRLLRHVEAPEDVCTVTIAHELVHYSHGFGSPLPQRFADPHADGIVDRELAVRGLGAAVAAYEHWATYHWPAFYERQKQRSRALSLYDTSLRPSPETPQREHAALDLPTGGASPIQASPSRHHG